MSELKDFTNCKIPGELHVSNDWSTGIFFSPIPRTNPAPQGMGEWVIFFKSYILVLLMPAARTVIAR